MKKDYIIYSDKVKSDKRHLIISDIHFVPGMDLSFLYSQLDFIKKEVPDAVIILGDIVNDGLYTPSELKELRKWLCQLSKVGCKVINILGNHDQLTQKYSDNWEECYNRNYINMLRNYNNFHVLDNSNLETEDIMFRGTCFPGNYYEERKEPVSEYKEELSKATFNEDKLCILLDHSPIRSFDREVFNSVKSLDSVDLIYSGHMHNGCVPTYISNWFPGNFGLIDPYMHLFPKNSRGKKDVTDKTTGIMSAPVTTFTGYQGLFQKLNVLYPPMTQQVLIKKK